MRTMLFVKANIRPSILKQINNFIWGQPFYDILKLSMHDIMKQAHVSSQGWVASDNDEYP